jgi:hypothetical protein
MVFSLSFRYFEFAPHRMSSPEKIRLHVVKPHWPHAWICVGLIALTACFAAMADGIQSWSVVGVYLIAAVSLFLSAQPWRSFLELTPDGFRTVWGVQSTVVRWRDIGDLRPVLAPSGHYGGVAFSATRQIQDVLGWRRTTGGITGTLNGGLYGVSDGKLYQLMYDLRSRAISSPPDAEARTTSGALAKSTVEIGEI